MARIKRKRRRNRGRTRRRSRGAELTAAELAAKENFEAAKDLLLTQTLLTDDDSRLLAHCHARLGEYEDASNVVSSIESKSLRDHGSHGLYLTFAKRWEEAEAALRTALSLDQESALLRYWLANALLRDSFSFYSMADEVRTEVRDLLFEACCLTDSVPDAFLTLDRLYEDENERLSLLRHGLEQHPDSVDIRYRLVRRLVFAGDFDEAEDVVAPLLVADEMRPDYLWTAFQIEARRGNHAAALPWVDRLIEHQLSCDEGSQFAGLHQIRGELLIQLDRPAEAAVSFRREINIKHQIDQILPIFGLAMAALCSDDIETATTHIELGIGQWTDRISNEMLPGEYEVIAGFEHQFDTCRQLRQRLEAVASQPAYKKLVAQIDYLIDRTHNHLPLKRLRPIARMLMHPILDYDFSMTYAKQRRWREALLHHLQFCFAMFQRDENNSCHFISTFYDERVGHFSDDTRLEIHHTIVSFLNGDEERRKASFVEHHILPLYAEFWRRVLFDGKMWKEALDVSSFLNVTCPDDTGAQFDKAYCLDMNEQRQEAIAVYRDLIAEQPEHSSALHNLSVLIEEVDCQEAIELARRAFEVAPDDDYCKRRWQAVQDIEERHAEAEAKRAEQAARQDEFLRTARERFPQLDFHKRRILSTLTVISSFDDLDHLADLSGTGRQYVDGNWRKLVEMGMIVEDESGNPSVNEYILDLVQQERSHAVATTLVRADDRIAFKPVFNSKLEYSIYNVMIGLFPNHLVFPNMSLQTVFQYEKIKALVDADTFRYFLMSQVDICITSTSSYLPIIAFEVDSHYHDGEPQQERDRKKNQLFQVGGVPLLRLRAHGQPTDATMRKDIIEAVRELGHELRCTHSKSQGLLKLELEIDFDDFGGPLSRDLTRGGG